ncbi:Protein of unknown function [Gryllus bimaculatus]|nr:Protein of unknown function [Gryllus bimaculatus]
MFVNGLRVRLLGLGFFRSTMTIEITTSYARELYWTDSSKRKGTVKRASSKVRLSGWPLRAQKSKDAFGYLRTRFARSCGRLAAQRSFRETRLFGWASPPHLG